LKQVLVFKLGGEYLACGVENVNEIIQYQSITPLPNMDHYVEGITNVRGQVYPVISLARRLGMTDSELGKQSRIIIVQVGENAVGMVVDDVVEVLKVEEAMEVPPPPMVSGGSESALVSIIKDGERLISFLDLSKIVDIDIAELILPA
jgi:purine-binding chemotaxis protein CheW